MTVIYYFCYPNRLSRLSLLLFWAFLFIFLLIGRSIVIASFTHAYAKGKYVRNVLFVGYGEKLAEFKKISQQEDQGLSPCGQYHGEKGPFECPQIEAETLEEAIEKTGADLIVISFPLEDSALENEMVAEGSDLLEQRLILLPHFPKSYAGTTIEDFHSIPVIHLNAAEMDMLQRIEKRTFDLVACSIAVVLLSPVYLILALLVKCSSKGPVFFKQARVTRDGKIFTMYKFRSMRTDMPEGKAHWTEENDPRVTRIGRILRKTSLDEIPQFFNVLGGSMSLIGPRPERPELEEGFKKTIPGYNMRHRMKAGISGWAQVNGLRGNTSLSKRIDYDLYYVRNWSIWFDFKIVFMTFFKGFVNKNAY
jgi:exopolysaccharide biosynthesis polyprenyl glycosylphosphotransferase